MSYGILLASLVAVVAMVLASCGSDDDSGDGADEPLLAADCDPIGVYCGLPFPSDVYLRDDPLGASRSGKTVGFGATTLPKVNGDRPIDPANFEDLDGWSVASSPMTYMPGATSTGLADPSSPLDFQILLQLIQLHWDRAEPSGFVHAMHRDPLPDTPEHHLLMHAAIGDHEVPTILAHSMARSIGAGLIRSDDPLQPFPRDVLGLEAVGTPLRDQSGLIEYEFALPPEPLTLEPATAGCNPHDRVRELTASFEQRDLFFRTGRIEWFCDGVCNCDGEREEDRCLESFEKECR